MVGDDPKRLRTLQQRGPIELALGHGDFDERLAGCQPLVSTTSSGEQNQSERAVPR